MGVLVAAGPSQAALTLENGQQAPGLEQRSGEGPWRAQPADVRRAEHDWFWFQVAAFGTCEAEPSAEADPAEPLDVAAVETGFDADWPLGRPDVPESQVQSAIRTTWANWPVARRTTVEDWSDGQPVPTAVGLLLGRAAGAPPRATARSGAAEGPVMSRGAVLGMVARRRTAHIEK
jgi:hypothetical protein